MFHWVRNNPLFAIIIWSNLKVLGLSLLALSVDTCIICVNHTQCFFYFLGCILTLQKLYSYILCRRGVGGGGQTGHLWITWIKLVIYALFIHTACIPCLSVMSWLVIRIDRTQWTLLPSDLPGSCLKGHRTVILSCNLLG